MITCSAINSKMLNPNFAIMCTPEASPDSFPDTKPFAFSSATYFLPMCTMIGIAISSLFLGPLSDRLGRRKIFMLVLGWVSAVGSVVKYFTRHTFWSFCISNFAFGFFLGNLPIGMAYIGDVEHNKKRKEKLLGTAVGCYVLGNSGGGIIAVLMYDVGLFSPLWIGMTVIQCLTLTSTCFLLIIISSHSCPLILSRRLLTGYCYHFEPQIHD